MCLDLSRRLRIQSLRYLMMQEQGVLMNEPHYPRDPKVLSRELSLVIELKDIKRNQELHEQLQDRWWDRFLLLLLFSSTIGFLLTLLTLKLAPRAAETQIIHYILYAAFLVMMVALVGVLEALLSKLQTLRRMVLLLEDNQHKMLTVLRENQKRDQD